MCHHYESTREWTWELEEESVEEDDDELPEFLNEEGNEDVEILADGGDDS